MQNKPAPTMGYIFLCYLDKQQQVPSITGIFFEQNKGVSSSSDPRARTFSGWDGVSFVCASPECFV